MYSHATVPADVRCPAREKGVLPADGVKWENIRRYVFGAVTPGKSRCIVRCRFTRDYNERVDPRSPLAAIRHGAAGSLSFFDGVLWCLLGGTLVSLCICVADIEETLFYVDRENAVFLVFAELTLCIASGSSC